MKRGIPTKQELNSLFDIQSQMEKSQRWLDHWKNIERSEEIRKKMVAEERKDDQDGLVSESEPVFIILDNFRCDLKDK